MASPTPRISSSSKSKKRPVPPKLGDPDYKTPTQLRNARKRRKVQNSKQPTKTARGGGGGGVYNTSNDHNSSTNKYLGGGEKDPSLRYLANPTAAPIVQRAVQFFEQEDIPFDVYVGPTSGWRTVARLAVRNNNSCLRIGLFVPGSHELLQVPQCQAHHPKINECVQVLQKKCRHHAIDAFDDVTGNGNLKHVAIHIERKTGRQQVTLIWKPSCGAGAGADAAEKQKQDEKLQQLCDTLVHVSESNDPRLNLHSLFVHTNNAWKHANSIMDRNGSWERKYSYRNADGDGDDVVEHLPTMTDSHGLTVPLRFPPQVFRQANLDAFSKIVLKIRELLQQQKDSPNKPHCVELYGGVGTIGLHVVDLVQSLVSSDENPFNKICFERTVSELKVRAPKKKCHPITYHSKNATDMVVESKCFQNNADLVIVDPPRKGLDDVVVEALCHEPAPKSLIYVSCGFDAFLRDYHKLTTQGHWILDHAEGHVLFPGSDAIETLAFFRRIL